MPTVGPSPNYTDESRRFQQALLDGEPGTENGGLYANKAGYHNLRRNLPMPGMTRDYSITAPVDKLGPDNKSAGHDWTFPEAQSGNFRRITLYTRRIQSAFWARDPRLHGWREYLGCLDGVTIGFDFDTWQTRKPDSTHKWHGHFSEHRAFVESWDNKVKMLEVLGLVATPDGGIEMLCQHGDVDTDARNARVAALQATLQRLGFLAGAIDGKYGNQTRDALAAACATVGWACSGDAYWAGEYAALQQVVAVKWGGSTPGPVGPPGPKGDDGDAATIPDGSLLRLVVAPTD